MLIGGDNCSCHEYYGMRAKLSHSYSPSSNFVCHAYPTRTFSPRLSLLRNTMQLKKQEKDSRQRIPHSNLHKQPDPLLWLHIVSGVVQVVIFEAASSLSGDGGMQDLPRATVAAISR